MLTLCSTGGCARSQRLGTAELDGARADPAGLFDQIVSTSVRASAADGPQGPPESRKGIEVTTVPNSGRRTMNAGSTPACPSSSVRAQIERVVAVRACGSRQTTRANGPASRGPCDRSLPEPRSRPPAAPCGWSAPQTRARRSITGAPTPAERPRGAARRMRRAPRIARPGGSGECRGRCRSGRAPAASRACPLPCSTPT